MTAGLVRSIIPFKTRRPISPLILDQGYINQKNQVIKAERRILKELGFCVHVKHPHKIIVMYLQVLGCEKNKNLMQLSWNYMNDALRSDCFMRFDPETVACACIYLSARYLGICLPKNPPWFDLFRVNEENIIVVCQKILLLYNRPKVNADDLERRVDELKKSYQELKAKQRIIVSGNNTPNSTNSPVRNNHSDKGRSRSDSRSRSASKTPLNTNGRKRIETGPDQSIENPARSTGEEAIPSPHLPIATQNTPETNRDTAHAQEVPTLAATTNITRVQTRNRVRNTGTTRMGESARGTEPSKAKIDKIYELSIIFKRLYSSSNHYYLHNLVPKIGGFLVSCLYILLVNKCNYMSCVTI
uniref:Cyclin-L2 n=1 Tax=Lygus hesperus TaxID=30085 RepID=A0A0K8SL52_LYGHE